MATLAWPCFARWVSPPTAPCRMCHGRSCPAVRCWRCDAPRRFTRRIPAGLDTAFQAGDPTAQRPYSVFLPLPRTALYLFSAAWPCRVPLARPRRLRGLR